MSDGAVIDLLLGAEVAATTLRTHPRHLVRGRADGRDKGGGGGSRMLCPFCSGFSLISVSFV